jgi:carbamoyl-phosphate synthase large subunit
MGFTLFATPKTAHFLKKNNLICTSVPKETSGAVLGVSDRVREGMFDLIINIPTHVYERPTTSGFRLRRAAVDYNIPLITNRQLAEAFVAGFAQERGKALTIKSRGEYERYEAH